MPSLLGAVISGLLIHGCLINKLEDFLSVSAGVLFVFSYVHYKKPNC